LSRNTVKKHLSVGTVEPKFAISDRPSKLDPFAEKLAAWLKSEAAKPRKQRRTLKQMHSELTALGFTGSYNRVAAFARDWRADRQREQQTTGRGTFVPLPPRPSGFKQSNTTVERSASSRPSSWSMPWNRRRPRARPASSPTV
jgi:hypothetical protein